MIDTHCHLDLIQKQESIKDILLRSSQSNVFAMQTISTRISEINKILDLIKKYDLSQELNNINPLLNGIQNTTDNTYSYNNCNNITKSSNKSNIYNKIRIFGSVGLHPLYVHEEKIPTVDDIIKLTDNKNIIGIGETGLDYYRCTNSESIALQHASFEAHIIAAQETGLPIIVHTRDAEDDTISIIKKYIKTKKFSGVIHCFTGSEILAREMIDIGFGISASGIVTFKNAKEIQKIFTMIPLDSILLETDSPYLAPIPYRGKNNEPSYIKEIALFLANLRQISFDDICNVTTSNFYRIFSTALKIDD
ncbi:TatD family hydrolase [Lyticum sinuosum]|uniref:TatD family deoxyribonuclease n=1 Tax=Lyticum sinuosum TaxID=1332059 RepID=A0AAE4VKA2_9RICK|nr:TatD family hydrolase [Lyticum sinuosum]MDZ5761545.1 TatD family deoxyribonuclease [Lyticum sinuosum]